MKNGFFYFITILLVLAAYSPSGLNAADLSIGATTWYTKYDTPDSWDFELDPAFLYGPVMSIKFNDDYSFTFVFLYGEFKTDLLGGAASIEIDRYDSDAALNYRLNSYLKIYAGAKYMGYTYKAEAWGIPLADIHHTGFGPGGGLNGVFPLGNDFYILANISAMYLWGKEDGGGNPEKGFKEYGINTGASIAYYIADASTTISLGGRYQAFRTNFEDNTYTADNSKFWGATLSATYSFSF